MTFKDIKNFFQSLFTPERQLSMLSIIISIIALGASVYFSIKTYSLDAEANALEKQLIDIEKNITNLQYEIHKITNFNTTIHGEVSSFYLVSYDFQLNENSSIDYIIMRGNLSTTFQIASPHITEFRMSIKDFTKPWQIFRKGYGEYTEVKFVNPPESFFVEKGVQSVEINYPLACVYHPINYLIPEPGQFEHFLFGEIEFEIILTDLQTGDVIIHSFKSDIIGKIVMPDYR